MEDILGRSVAELLGRETFESLVKGHLDRCLSGEVVNYQDWFDFPAVGSRFLDVFYYPVFDADQTISEAVVSSRILQPARRPRMSWPYIAAVWKSWSKAGPGN